MAKQHSSNIVTVLTENDEGGFDCIVRNAETGQECTVSYEHDCDAASMYGEAFCSTALAVERLMTEIAQANMAFGDWEGEDDGAGLEAYYDALVNLLQTLY